MEQLRPRDALSIAHPLLNRQIEGLLHWNTVYRNGDRGVPGYTLRHNNVQLVQADRSDRQPRVFDLGRVAPEFHEGVWNRIGAARNLSCGHGRSNGPKADPIQDDVIAGM